MDNLLTVEFQAHNAEQNHHRRYAITVGRDLLDDWTVSIRYGRIGQRGQELRFTNHEADEMRAVVRDRLRRRLSAVKRIGCPYRLTKLDIATDFDSNEWLPANEIAKFFTPVIGNNNSA
jgi:predicted DNA-binding WGR domain protein